MFNANKVAVCMKNIKFRFNKPICVGRSIAHLAKPLMYYFQYNVIKTNMEILLKYVLRIQTFYL